MDALQSAVMRARADKPRPTGIPAGHLTRPEVVDPFFLHKLLAEVAQSFGLTAAGLQSQRRFSTYFAARCEFCYRAFMESNVSLVRIGKVLGARDHTTIRNAIAQHCVNRKLPLPPGVNWDYWIERRAAQPT